jgi:hypothetical protein
MLQLYYNTYWKYLKEEDGSKEELTENTQWETEVVVLLIKGK